MSENMAFLENFTIKDGALSAKALTAFWSNGEGRKRKEKKKNPQSSVMQYIFIQGVNMSSCILFHQVIRLPVVFYASIKQLTHIKQKEFTRRSPATLREQKILWKLRQKSASEESDYKYKICVRSLLCTIHLKRAHTLPVHIVHKHLTHPGSSAVSGFGSILARLLDEEAALHMQFLDAGSDLPVPY